MTDRSAAEEESRPGDPSAAAADPDAELLSRHLAGDRAAFGDLVRRHQDRLWAVALRTLGDREEAADALQDALLSAYRAAPRFRGEARVGTWLHRIVVNACLDRARRRQARPTVPLPDEDRVPAAADDIGRRELALDLATALATLPVDQRAALVLVDVEGWTVEEAAGALRVPAGTVKSRCARGRAKLVKALTEFPAMNRAFVQADGKPAVVEPEHVSLGLDAELGGSAHADLDRLADYDEGLLDQPAAAELDRHLDGCQACRQRLSALHADHDLVEQQQDVVAVTDLAD